MRKKIFDKKLEDAILHLLQEKIRSMSIREITKNIEKEFGIKRSPQIIKRHLESLLNKEEVIEVEKNA